MESAELVDFVLQGPLLRHCNLDKQGISTNIEEWHELTALVATSLGYPALETEAQRKRVLHYYLPAYFWVKQQITAHQEAGTEGPCVVGISAPQGCGKTTLVTELEKLLSHQNLPSATISIDDFYLTHSDQTALATQHSDNWLLQGRGHAGTHDVSLGTSILQQLTNTTEPVQVPRYNKSAFSGAGDRADHSSWPTVSPPLSVVLFEGWMLGFRPVGEAAAAEVDASLVEIDRRLAAYEAAWDAFAHAWLVVEVADPSWVYTWRQEAEHKMKAEGKDGMTDDQIKNFVARYMPAYTAYLPGLYEKGPTTSQAGRTLFIQVDEQRSLVGGRVLEGTS